ncbi:MAG: PDZ domain-containing protein [Candidatus Omnitrophica bacterium]|nr:PDZ domain-containing protein [Candidatus Omnitrophota bacterium]
MLEQLDDYKKRNRQKFLLILVLSILGLFCIAALMHIGAGDAEWAGMTVSNLTPTIAMEFNVPKDEKGVVVNWCEDSSYSSGLRGGDLLKAINNKKVKNISEFLKATKGITLDKGALLDVMRNGQPLYLTLKDKKNLHDDFKKMLGAGIADTPVTHAPAVTGGHMSPIALDMRMGSRPQQIAFGNRLPGETAETGVGMGGPSVNMAPQASQLPTPKEQGAAQKELVEGHWLGMEVIPLVPELAKEFNIDPKTKGILVDEISLESAESGVLAGDMVIGVDGYATPDIEAFTEATRRVRNRLQAKIYVNRRGRLLDYIISSTKALGFSQNESAQPIKPGAISPHRSRGKACTVCHIIMVTGGQLPIDAGDILPSPPPIIKGAIPPHEDRGKCNTCHVILKSVAMMN